MNTEQTTKEALHETKPVLGVVFIGTDNIEKLLANLPKFGWGEPVSFSNSTDDFKQVKDILESDPELWLVFNRSKYLENDGKLDFGDWVESILIEYDNFTTYMLKTFGIKNGKFIVPENTDINYLAGKYLEYYA